MSVYCIIPARKGSKRTPNKNTRRFCGLPMVEHARGLATAALGLQGHVAVSDDDNRPKELCDDHTGLLEVMAWHAEGHYSDDVVICLLPCTPLLSVDSLQRAIKAYARFYADTDEMLACVQEYAHPVARSMDIGANGELRILAKKYAKMRTQDLETRYHDAGAFYIATAKRWMSDKPILDGARPWILSRTEHVDIDTEEDWQLAEAIYRGRK